VYADSIIQIAEAEKVWLACHWL